VLRVTCPCLIHGDANDIRPRTLNAKKEDNSKRSG
jgi:hypothetical protein